MCVCFLLQANVTERGWWCVFSTTGKCKRGGSGVCFLLQANVRETEVVRVSSTAGTCKREDGGGVCLISMFLSNDDHKPSG